MRVHCVYLSANLFPMGKWNSNFQFRLPTPSEKAIQFFWLSFSIFLYYIDFQLLFWFFVSDDFGQQNSNLLFSLDIENQNFIFDFHLFKLVETRSVETKFLTGTHSLTRVKTLLVGPNETARAWPRSPSPTPNWNRNRTSVQLTRSHKNKELLWLFSSTDTWCRKTFICSSNATRDM